MQYNEEDSAHLFIAKETQKNWKPQLDSFSIQKRNLKSRRIRLSVDRPVDRPKSRSTERSTASTREQNQCQSIDRLSAVVDRAVDRYCLCTLVHIGRPVKISHVGIHLWR